VEEVWIQAKSGETGVAGTIVARRTPMDTEAILE
jgi:hypothetical protein